MFLIAFIAAAGAVKGADAGVDEKSIYDLKELYKYESNVNEVKLIVENLRLEVQNETTKLEENSNPNYFDEIVDMSCEIQELRFYNGFTDVRGPGIMVRVSDSKSEDFTIDIMDKIVHDVDITILLNDLKSAGAEAIDVNGKRIINISEVVCAGPLLQINGEGVPAPFVIRAVGNQDDLYNAINNEGTYAYTLKNQWGMEVATIMSDYLSIPRFDDEKYEIKYTETTN